MQMNNPEKPAGPVMAAYQYDVRTGDYRFHRNFGALDETVEKALLDTVQSRLKESILQTSLLDIFNFAENPVMVYRYGIKDQFERDGVGANVIYIKNSALRRAGITYFSFLPDIKEIKADYKPQSKPTFIKHNILNNSELLLYFISALDTDSKLDIMVPKNDLDTYRNLISTACALLPNNGISFNYFEECPADVNISITPQEKRLFAKNYYYLFDMINKKHPKPISEFYQALLKRIKQPPFFQDILESIRFFQWMESYFGRRRVTAFLEEHQ